METCNCQDTTHENHLNAPCTADATTESGKCADCAAASEETTNEATNMGDVSAPSEQES